MTTPSPASSSYGSALVTRRDGSGLLPAGRARHRVGVRAVENMRAYDPVAVAATLDVPMMFMQGERDYQVTIGGDLAGWRAGLAGHPGITTRTYPADDHMFSPGAGSSMPADCTRPHHVGPEVVADIADWMRSHG